MVVLDEAVLHRLIGSPQVMHDALVQVAELSQRPYIVVQVVPTSNGANAGLGGAFYIAMADGMPETLQMVGVEDQTDGEAVTGAEGGSSLRPGAGGRAAA